MSERTDEQVELTDDERARLCAAWRCDGYDDTDRCVAAIAEAERIVAERLAGVRAALDYDPRDGSIGNGVEPGAWRRGARHVAVRVRRALEGDLSTRPDTSGDPA